MKIKLQLKFDWKWTVILSNLDFNGGFPSIFLQKRTFENLWISTKGLWYSILSWEAFPFKKNPGHINFKTKIYLIV